jgi:hypothetical protein
VAIDVDDPGNWTALVVLVAGWPLTCALVGFFSSWLKAVDHSVADQDFWVGTEWTQTFQSYVLF